MAARDMQEYKTTSTLIRPTEDYALVSGFYTGWWLVGFKPRFLRCLNTGKIESDNREIRKLARHPMYAHEVPNAVYYEEVIENKR
jgi:hypothetical protein